MIKNLILLLAAAFCLTGCINVNYVPANAEMDLAPTSLESVKVFKTPSKVKKQYQTIGYCIASGNYRDFSKKDIVDKLRDEAAKVGADGVVIKTYAVVPTGSERLEQLTDMQNMNSETFPEGDVGVSGWNRLAENFDSGYGSIRERKTVRTYGYRRVIRAKFISFKSTPAIKPAKPAKPAKPLKTITVVPDKKKAPAKK